MTLKHKWKVGDKFIRIGDHGTYPRVAPKGYVGTFTALASYGIGVKCEKGYNHSYNLIEPYTLETALKYAKEGLETAQRAVNDLEQQIRERDAPKVGDWVTWDGGAFKGKLVHIEGPEGVVFIPKQPDLRHSNARFFVLTDLRPWPGA